MQPISLTNNEIFKRLRKIAPADHAGLYPFDDQGNGKLFAEVFSDCLRYNTDTKSYCYYDGTKWNVDTGNKRAEELAQRLKTALELLYANNKSALEYYSKLGGHSKRMTMISDAAALVPVGLLDFDTNKDLLNLQNGTLDLRTMQFREHRADDLLMCVANAEYDPAADCPTFKRFIAEVTQAADPDGSMIDDPDKAEYLQRILGYCLTADCREDEFYLLYGVSTRNGKSTLLSVIGHILGDYGVMIESDALSQQRDTKETNEQRADLRGKRFAHVEEPSKSMILDTGLIKQLTGGTKMRAARKYEHSIEFVPEFKIVFATNYLPTVTDDTLFKSGRCKVVTFERHFTDEEQDKDLRSKLIGESSGILNWLLEGLRLYRKKGTKPPESVAKATSEYQEVSDRVANFLRECTVECKGEWRSGNDLYEVYRQWCDASGYTPDGKHKFFESLRRKKLLEPYKKIDGVVVRNIVLNRKIDSNIFDAVRAEDTPFTEGVEKVENL